MLKAVYYINQFFAGLGGEEMAHEGLHVFDGAKGPAVGLAELVKNEMTIVKSIACGDNFFNTDANYEEIKSELLSIVRECNADIVIAGPAFNAGRYGVACGKFCELIQSELGIPTVTAMFKDNPAVPMYLRKVYIMECGETAAEMKKALPPLAKMALKLAKKELIGPAPEEGYFPTGYRRNELDERSAASRVVDMLVKKMKGEPYRTEVELRSDEKVQSAPPLDDYSKAKFAIITTGGLVPKGNPDKLRMYSSVSYGTYEIDPKTLNSKHYESVHGGYDTTAVNKEPQRLVPYNATLDLKKRGLIGDIAQYFLSTCGIGTNVTMGKKLGAQMAEQLKKDDVSAAFLTST